MKRKLRLLFSIVFSVTVATPVYAGEGLTPPADGIPVSTNQAADTASSTNNSAGQMAQALGQALTSQGTQMMPGCQASMCSCCPQAAMLIAMGLLAMLQGMANSGASDQQAYVADTASSNSELPPGVTPPTPNSPTFDTEGTLQNIPAFAAQLKEAEKYGVTYKDGKMVLPNGKSFKLSDVNNQAAMANAGVSSGEFAKAMGKAAELEKKMSSEALTKVGAHTASQGFDGGGGGGSSIVNSAAEEMAAAASKAKARDPAASVAGMTKSYNGESIGVAGDSLFEMMARRYRQKSKEESFLPPESAPISAN